MGYIDQNRQEVIPGRQIGRRGGEGLIFNAESHPGHVVKLYHNAIDPLKASKLSHFCQISSEGILKVAAWPTSLVWDRKDSLRGLLLPLVDGKEIHQLFDTKERFIEFPRARWDFLIRVARNCAVAFDQIHRLGVVIGDVNEGNVMVRRDGIVRLIDCDSYQARNDGHVWTCDVGVNLWTPPELQRKSFRGLLRTPNHDVFGLAVLIFKLLFMGRHPYFGVSPAGGSADLVDAIATFKYAFSERASKYGVQPPPNCLPIEVLPRNYRDLFERAFARGSDLDGARPSAREWALALENIERSLRACAVDPSHIHPSHLSVCPWCQIADSGGLNFFVNVRISVHRGKNPADLWRDIDGIAQAPDDPIDLKNISFPACKPGIPPEPRKTIRPAFYWAVLLMIVGFLVLSTSIATGAGIAVIGCGLAYTGVFGSSYAVARKQRTEKLRLSMGVLQAGLLERDRVQNAYKQLFLSVKSEFRTKYERLIKLEAERRNAIRGLEDQKRKLQLDAFLDRQLLAHAKIAGIGAVKRQTLAVFGIESAFDVTRAGSVPGIGDELYARLLEWRGDCESRFFFNPKQAIPASDLHQINVRFSNLYQGLESELLGGPPKLEQINRDEKRRREPVNQQIQELLRDCSQARSDLNDVPPD